MCFEEAPCVLYDFVDVLLRIFPWVDGHLRIRGEASHLLAARRSAELAHEDDDRGPIGPQAAERYRAIGLVSDRE